jgi:predicted acyltransferase
MTATPPRDQSLDSFRGGDVLLMILVNVQGSDADAFGFLKHATWNGLTLADIVFPVFLLIVGLSAPLALDRPGAVINWAAIIRRAALLFGIGVGLSWLIRPSFDPDMIRWSGVLQRIAIVYLVCAVVILMRRGIGLAIGLATLILAVHTWMLLHVGAPSGGGPSLEPGMGISGWLDQNFIPGKVLRKTWEPEGILSTFPAIANGLIGVVIMRWIKSGSGAVAKLFGAGLSLLLCGWVITVIVPINKNLWTASFTLITCGIGLLIWACLKAAWPLIGSSRIAGQIARWTVTLGQAALTLYVVHTLLIAIIVRQLPSGDSVWTVSYNALASTGLPPPLASLLYACVAAGLSCAILPWLKRRGWILRV